MGAAKNMHLFLQQGHLRNQECEFMFLHANLRRKTKVLFASQKGLVH